MDSVFIAQTPLQLINLYEASKHYKVNGQYILFYDNLDNYARMKELVKVLEVEQFIFFKIDFKFRMFFPLILSRIIKKLKPTCRQGFYGTYASWSAWIINSLAIETAVLVDDGHKTVNLIKVPEITGVFKKSRFKKLSKAFVQNSNFFTFYADFAKKNGFQSEQNSLKYVQKVFSRHQFDSAISIDQYSCFFISTNILARYKSIELYIEKVANSSERMLYIMHRYDDEELVSEWAQKYQFDCVKFEYPIELYFSLLSESQRVMSFGSTAIDTLSMMKPEVDITLYRLPLDGFDSDSLKVGFTNVWKYSCENSKVKCIDLHLD